MVDPSVSSPLKIGLFKVREEENQEILDWSVSRLDIVGEMGRKLIGADSNATEFLFSRNPGYREDDKYEEPQWLAWSRREGRSVWSPVGGHDHFLRSSSSKASLRAFGLRSGQDMSSVSAPAVEFPDGLKGAVLESIDRISRQLSHVKHIKLKLERRDEMCNIGFLEPQSGKPMHSLRMRNTADLIGLLRWPMTEGRPLRLSEDLLVTWDPFHDFSHPSPDIDFGEDYKSLSSQLISVTDSEGMIFPPALSAYEVLQITISHDSTHCPLVEGSGRNHASCWGVEIPSGTAQNYLDMIDTEHYLTDREVSKCFEKLTQSIGKGLMSIMFDHGADSDDRLVFNESEVMREISREYRGIPMANFAPGHTVRIKLRKKLLEVGRRGLVFIEENDDPE